MSVLRAFGFEDFTASLSTRPPEKSVGTDEGWAAAEAALEAALKAEGVEYDIDEGGGAFYGPKIDVKVRDAIGRSWQLSTNQYDFNMDALLELAYIGSDNARPLPIILQRTLCESMTHSFGGHVTHFAVAYPAGLAPR